MASQPQGEGRDTGRAMVGGCRRGAEGGRQPDLDRATRGMESPETAHGRGFRSIVESGATEIRGTDRAARGIVSRMRHRTGRSPGQAANPVEGCFSFLAGNIEPGAVGVGVLIQITPQLRI